MLEKIEIQDEGPDGMYLVVQGEFDFGAVSASGKLTGRVNDDLLHALDKAMQPWREHMTEGERVRQEYEAHRRSGYCGEWVPGHGPCYAEAGHEGDHQPSWLGRD
jgi:hypothetical protein